MHWFWGQEALEVTMSEVIDMDIKLSLYVADGDLEETVNQRPRFSLMWERSEGQ